MHRMPGFLVAIRRRDRTWLIWEQHRNMVYKVCNHVIRYYLLGIAVFAALGWHEHFACAQSLEVLLRQQSPEALVAQARNEGDAVRGAIVFFQPTLACSKCHSVGDAKKPILGPNLAAPLDPLSDVALVESVIEPSKLIRKSFETVRVVTTGGQVLSGLPVERTDEKVVLRDATGQLVTVRTSDIEAFANQSQSLMPSGQVDQLSSRQQFLDLIRYLIEIRDGGVDRARQLQPSESLLTLKLPEYELRVDHGGLMSEWGDDSLVRGEAIYRRVCANCHGTLDSPGTLPTAPRFAEGKFKNGIDPLSMYRTLTRGFGFMPAQTWMVPSQKYDVIHYLRETFLRNRNPSQLATVDSAYLASLPKGDTRGPNPSQIETWSAMDYGPSLTHTYETPGDSLNIAYKGIAVRLDPGPGGVARGSQWMIFDTDTMRVASAWSAGEDSRRSRFIDWHGIQFNGQHNIHPRIAGSMSLANSNAPGWANPTSGSFEDDQRVVGRDDRRYGPLPRQWAKFRGLYHHGSRAVLSYTIGNTTVLEMPGSASRADGSLPATFLRTFDIGARDRDLVMRVADILPDSSGEDIRHDRTGLSVAVEIAPSPEESRSAPPSSQSVSTQDDATKSNRGLCVGILPSDVPVSWLTENGQLRLKISAGVQTLRFTLWALPESTRKAAERDLANYARAVAAEIPDAQLDLSKLTRGGPSRWPQVLETKVETTFDRGPFATDVLSAPEANPWLAQTRFTGLDFFNDGRLAVCSWDGDVWVVSHTDGGSRLRWQRIASGMFQPLGIKVIDEKIRVLCRDQLAVLHDFNGDGETDYYECLNNDHQVTEHFHEFAMGLQTDAEGNFYYAKSARHALPAIVPHHGTLLRVSRDGLRTDILANGFRAANGVCLNPDGSFVVTDQEGHWNPKNRINWVTLDPSGKPKFYGNMFGYHAVTDDSDSVMEPPLCWITNAFDRSPAELLWVASPRWGPLQGSLLNLSYGYGKVFLVMHEQVGGTRQGGMLELPVPQFPTGVMRGRFHPLDQQLYMCGMFAWAGNATYPGGLYRVRATGKPMHLPISLHARKSGIELAFAEPLDPTSLDPDQVQVKVWSLKRSAKYGSEHYDEETLNVRAAQILDDGKTVRMVIDDLRPTWCMEIKYSFLTLDGESMQGVIHNTIHQLAE